MTDTRKNGLASVDPERRRELGSRGGHIAHESGRAHEFDSVEAAQAGRLGGLKTSQDRAHMAAIGRRGGRAAARTKRAQTQASVNAVTNPKE